MASALYHAIISTSPSTGSGGASIRRIDAAPEHGEWIDSEGRYFLDVAGEISDRHTLIRICNTLWQTLVYYPKPLLATSVPFGHARTSSGPPPAESEEVKKNRRGFARAVQQACLPRHRQANALELALEYAIQHDRQVSLVWTATSGPHRGEG